MTWHCDKLCNIQQIFSPKLNLGIILLCPQKLRKTFQSVFFFLNEKQKKKGLKVDKIMSCFL